MKNTLINGADCRQSGLQGYERKLMSKPDEVVNDIIEVNNALLLASPKEPDSTLSCFSANNTLDVIEGIRDTVVIASLDTVNATFTGAWSVELFPLSQITTLFSFLDYQMKPCAKTAGPGSNKENSSVLLENERSIILLMEGCSSNLMDMLINGMLNPLTHSLQNIFNFVRNVESYWVSYFLLSQVFNEDKESDSHKLYNACKIYGVSESYFRKLCHNAFTRGPKKQLRMWRAAHSALQLIEKDKSISTIAGNNGYSSSSHFSSEIKSLFGITPREFKKLEGLLHE